NAANTGASTININSLGSVSIKKSAGANLEIGDIVVNTVYELVYWAGSFRLISGSGGGLSAIDGLSVLGNPNNTTGLPSAITASANDTVLRLVSDAITFGKLTVGMAPNNLWTYAKIQQVSANRLLGNPTGSTANVQEIGLTSDLTFSGGNIGISYSFAAQFWRLANGGTLTGNNTIDGSFNIAFNNSAIGIGVPLTSIPTDTRLYIRGFGVGTNFSILTVDPSNNWRFWARNNGSFGTIKTPNQEEFYVDTTTTRVVLRFLSSASLHTFGFTQSGALRIYLSGQFQVSNLFLTNSPTGETAPGIGRGSGNLTGSGIFYLQGFLSNRNNESGIYAYLYQFSPPSSGSFQEIFRIGSRPGDADAPAVISSSSNNSFNFWSLHVIPQFNLTGTGAKIIYGIDYDPDIVALNNATHIGLRITQGVVLIGGTTVSSTGTRVDIRGTGTGTNNTLRLADSGNNPTFRWQDNGRMFIEVTPQDATNTHQFLFRDSSTGEVTKLGFGSDFNVSSGNLIGNFWRLSNGGTLTGANTIIGSTSNTLTLRFDALGTTITDGAGIWLRNQTNAANNAQQISPVLTLEGQGWRTDSGGASEPVRFAQYVLPVQGC
ncbi:MAG: hypothetical protein NZ108_07450, partial [Bacteroidia bacterium]|nr:hypothetical protein [Bacteroidia bacterium]